MNALCYLQNFRERQRSRPYNYIMVMLGIVCVALTGCAQDSPAPLINGIASRQSFQQVERLMRPKGPWRPSEDREALDNFSISNYEHLGVPGTLKFFFLKDQLVSTTFEPSDFPKYKILLEKQLKISFMNQSGIRRGNTWVGIGGHPGRKDEI